MMEEEEARSRQIFDPSRQEFDDRKRRVTDLSACSRVTLPRPVSIQNEAAIEMRTSAQEKFMRSIEIKSETRMESRSQT